VQTTDDPGMSEWGNPLRFIVQYPLAEYIGRRKLTQGIETSKYLVEEKVTTIPLVAASESGTAQTVMVSSLQALP
jgi:hypothetical protein